MNVGYTSTWDNESGETIESCPLCGSDIYGSKYGGDYVCMDKCCGDRSMYEVVQILKESLMKKY